MTRSEILKMKDSDLDKTIKIQGTRFDRKRKVSNATITRMRKMFNKGKSISEISNITGICYSTVRYNVDDNWRKQHIASLSGKHTGNTNITKEDRILYKRAIVDARKMRVFA
mgnify:FL=1